MRVLLIRKAQPDAALADIESNFESLSVPFVDEAVAAARQLAHRGPELLGLRKGIRKCLLVDGNLRGEQNRGELLQPGFNTAAMEPPSGAFKE